jgi:hypothetical protein
LARREHPPNCGTSSACHCAASVVISPSVEFCCEHRVCPARSWAMCVFVRRRAGVRRSSRPSQRGPLRGRRCAWLDREAMDEAPSSDSEIRSSVFAPRTRPAKSRTGDSAFNHPASHFRPRLRELLRCPGGAEARLVGDGFDRRRIDHDRKRFEPGDQALPRGHGMEGSYLSVAELGLGCRARSARQ